MEIFKSMGGGNFPGGSLMGGNFSGRNFPDTGLAILNLHMCSFNRCF